MNYGSRITNMLRRDSEYKEKCKIRKATKNLNEKAR